MLGLAGWSGSGKTTLLLALVALLKRRGLRVATLKHAHHGFDVDQPGKDSFAHREAGADQVLVASSRRIALMVEAPLPDPDARRALDDLLPLLGPACLPWRHRAERSGMKDGWRWIWTGPKTGSTPCWRSWAEAGSPKPALARQSGA